MASAIAVRGFTKRYGAHVAVSGVDFEVHAGEVFALLGPNGAGKSTIVRAIVGLHAPTSGSVFVGGFDVSAEPVRAKRCFGYVPETSQLYESLTAVEYLTLVARLREIPDSESRPTIDCLLAAWDLAEAASAPLASLSKGMKQKVAILAALLSGPRILILDEPLSGLDAGSALVVRALVRAFAERGGTVFYTSHLLDVVEKVADRVAILVEGNLVAVGTVAEVRSQSGAAGDLGSVFASLARTGEPRELAREILDAAGAPASARAGKQPAPTPVNLP